MYRFILAFILILLPLFSYGKDVYVIEVEGVITGYSEKYIETSLKEAADNNGALLIRMDTPGGLLESTRGIVQILLESSTPVVVFVSPQGSRAGSAGTFITLASHFAAMAEGTNIGAAHPVNITGKDFDGHMAEKIENDTVAFIRSIAEKRGRNTEAAVNTVLESKSYTSGEALELGLIDAVANSNAEVAKLAGAKLGFETGSIIVLKATPIQKVAFFLSDPNVLIMLLFIGILAIVLEFKMPGTFVFAVVGIAAIIMFLMGINIIPVNLLALMLVILGIGLLGAEIFIPSFGLLTLAATVSLGTGMFLLFSKEGNMGVGVSLWLIGIMLGLILAIALLIGRLIFKDFKSKPKTGKEALIGKTGKVMNWDGLNGQVFVYGEIWNASCEETLEKDEKIIILAVDGMNLKVEKESV